MLSARTKLSFCQYLALQEKASLAVLFEKHNAPIPDGGYSLDPIGSLRVVVSDMPEEQLRALLDEILRTQGDLR